MPSSFFKKLQNMVDSDAELEDLDISTEKTEGDQSLKGAPILEQDESKQEKQTKESLRKKGSVLKKSKPSEQQEEELETPLIEEKTGNIKISTSSEIKETPHEDTEESLSLRERIRETSVFMPSTQNTKIEEARRPILKTLPRKWPEPTGQLAVDVFELGNDLIIQSAIAGVKPENIDIDAQGDNVVIKGKRENPQTGQKNYFTQECYWGHFSKEIILPVEADPSRAEASLIDGVLTIKIPKIEKDKKSKIEVR